MRGFSGITGPIFALIKRLTVMNMARRPATQKTRKTLEIIIAAIADGANLADAARAAGVGRATIYAWAAADAAFAADLETAKEAGRTARIDEVGDDAHAALIRRLRGFMTTETITHFDADGLPTGFTERTRWHLPSPALILGALARADSSGDSEPEPNCWPAIVYHCEPRHNPNLNQEHEHEND